jgi:Domain of unknown function (DUF4432)
VIVGGLHRIHRNWGARIHEFQLHGLDLVVLENELLRVSLLAGRGCDVVEFNYKPRDMDVVPLRQRALTPVAVSAAAAAIPHDLAFLEMYSGGWQEVFPNGGAPSEYAGARFGQHDDVAHLPWDYVIEEDSPTRVSVRFSVRTRRMPFVLERLVGLERGSPCLELASRIANESDRDLPVMWGHHFAFGAPFLDDSCRIVLPGQPAVIPHDTPIHPDGRRIHNQGRFGWPHASGADGDPVDLSRMPQRGTPSDIAYITDLPTGAYQMWSERSVLGVRVAWDNDVMPYLWLWQEPASSPGYPWWSGDYLIGLEPFSSYPTNGLAEAVANGSALHVGGAATVQAETRIEVIEALVTAPE